MFEPANNKCASIFAFMIYSSLQYDIDGEENPFVSELYLLFLFVQSKREKNGGETKKW